MREISTLLFVFALFSFVVAVVLILVDGSNLDSLAIAVGGLVQAVIYAGLAFMIRRGSVISLGVAGALFVMDTLLMFLEPSGKGLGVSLVSRGILIYVVARYISRERSSSSEPAALSDSDPISNQNHVRQ